MRKIVLYLTAVFLITIIIFYFIPVKRSFIFKLIVQATPASVYEELLQKTEWNNWYFNGDITKYNQLIIQPQKQDAFLSYIINEKGSININGTFKTNLSLDGGTILEWSETVCISHGLTGKIQLIIWPSYFETTLSQSLNKLKMNLEKPLEILAGVHFKVYQMKGHAMAAINDTVPFANAEQKIIQLFQKIRSQFNSSALADTNRLTSRYELLNDSSINLEVGLRMRDATINISSPLKRLEVPSVLIVIASSEKNYQKSGEMVQNTQDWVKKYNLKLASPFWFEHSIKFKNGIYQLGDTLRIIQPFYHWLYPVEDTY